MIDFYDPGNYLCAVCGSVWTQDGVDNRLDTDDDEAMLFFAHQGCRDCIQAKGSLLDQLIQAGVVQPGGLDDVEDENMERFFAPAYYAVMQRFFADVGTPLPHVRSLQEMLAWAQSKPADAVAGNADAAEIGVLPRCHDELDHKAPDHWRFLSGFVDVGVDRIRVPYTPEILRVQQILDGWKYHFIQKWQQLGMLTYGQFATILSFAQREFLGTIQQELDDLLAYGEVEAWLQQQPQGMIVGRASRASSDQDERHASNVLASYVSARLGIVVYINWKGVRVGNLDAPCYQLSSFCFRYLQLLDCMAAGTDPSAACEVSREVALAMWELLKEML